MKIKKGLVQNVSIQLFKFLSQSQSQLRIVRFLLFVRIFKKKILSYIYHILKFKPRLKIIFLLKFKKDFKLQFKINFVTVIISYRARTTFVLFKFYFIIFDLFQKFVQCPHTSFNQPLGRKIKIQRSNLFLEYTQSHHK